MRLFASARERRRVLVHLLVGSLLFLGAMAALREQLSFVTDAAAMRAYVRGFGVWAPLALIALQALQVVLAPVPGQVLAAVAGYLFGPWWGTLFNVIGIGLGSAVAFWLSRRFGRAYVERTVHADVLERFDALVERRGLPALFVLFLIPGLPDDALCFLGGLTPIPLRRLVVVAVVGRAPAFFLVNVFGARLAAGDPLGAGVLFGAVTVLAVLGYLYRERIVDALDGWLG
ncbi:TVP38/TMEM64 family protein [Haloplanus halophilus]|uniref:TVP38/TMEM64 family protein n=1 Tax=Haloplanus halophilus TaxID=2949993 RepID=UPI00203BA00A|nr:TVP38/TMEM64 family protein [Haloplanus sp. GDY1]